MPSFLFYQSFLIGTNFAFITYSDSRRFSMFKDNFFKRVQNKTNVNKETILALAKKLQDSNMKNEDTLREVVKDISNLTGKEVSKEKEDKIINAIMQDKVPKDIDKMF